MVEKRYFTAQNLSDWVEKGQYPGLTENIISKVRAEALIKHPDVNPDLVLLSVIYVDEKPAAFTAYFPESFIRPQLVGYGWGTTQYTYPEFRGRKLGFENIKMMKESCGYKYLALDSSEASTYIDQKLGSKIIYYDRYMFVFNYEIPIHGIRNILQHLKWKLVMLLKKRKRNVFVRMIRQQEYQLEYVNHVDEETYRFICEMSTGDYFLRSRETLNWILKYKMKTRTPLINRVVEHPFGSAASDYSTFAVKVHKKEELVGFYMLRKRNKELSLLYFYSRGGFETLVASSVAEHVLSLGINVFKTMNQKLRTLLSEYGVAIDERVEKVSFTVPVDFAVDKELKLQGGDGDMFV